MDEPLGALDKKLRDWLQLEIRRIHAEVGSTFVYVTHDQDEALSMSDRVAVFNNGRIEQVGTPAELYDNPRTLFVGEFIGESTTLNGTAFKGSTDTWTVKGAENWQALKQDSVADGADVALLIRPEHIRLVKRDETPAPSGINRAAVTVEDFIYLGTGYKCKFILADGCEGVARIPAIDGLGIRIGDAASIEWNVGRGVLLNA